MKDDGGSKRARRRWHPALEWLRLPLIAALVLASLPVTFPMAMMHWRWTEHRKRRRARETRCVQCGAILGESALRRSDEAWAAHMERLFREHPGVRFRVVRNVHAMCVSCGQQYRYDEAANVFLPQASE